MGVKIERDFGSIIGFIDTLYTALGTTGNYSAIAGFLTLQFAVISTPALGLLQFP
jgi:hypothetical protein